MLITRNSRAMYGRSDARLFFDGEHDIEWMPCARKGDEMKPGERRLHREREIEKIEKQPKTRSNRAFTTAREILRVFFLPYLFDD